MSFPLGRDYVLHPKFFFNALPTLTGGQPLDGSIGKRLCPSLKKKIMPYPHSLVGSHCMAQLGRDYIFHPKFF